MNCNVKYVPLSKLLLFLLWLTNTVKIIVYVTCFISKVNAICPQFIYMCVFICGQRSWLQIRRPGFDSRHYQNKKKVLGLERGPLSLVSTTEELLDKKKVAAPV
jgi:hypothetical protein